MTESRLKTQDSRLAAVAAVRHLVYRDLMGHLPVASRDQCLRMMANLRLRSELRRFLDLRVSPGLGETNYRGATLREIEQWLNRRYGERLADVPGFYRRPPTANGQPPPPFRLNLPADCALYAYRSHGGFLAGILCQPLDRLNSFFLLSSAKFGGPRAAPLSPVDQVYFSQYLEVRV